MLFFNEMISSKDTQHYQRMQRELIGLIFLFTVLQGLAYEVDLLNPDSLKFDYNLS